MEAIYTHKSNWWGFISKRVLIAAIIIILVSMLIFLPIQVIFYNNPLAGAIGGDFNDYPAALDEIRTEYHLHDPLVVQYFNWIGNIFTGNWGTSIFRTMPDPNIPQPRHYERSGSHNPGWIPDP